MNKKVITLTAVTVFSLSALAPIGQVFATENTNQSLQNTPISPQNNSNLFEKIQKNSQNLTYSSFIEDNTQINELTNSQGNVVAVKTIQLATKKIVTVTRLENKVLIEIQNLTKNNQYITNQKEFFLTDTAQANILQNNDNFLTQNNIYRSSWEYTGLAIGRNAFALLGDITLGGAIGYIASIFGISNKAANYLLSYMGIRYVSTGAALADALDTNHNGWIGLYKRGVYHYKGGGFIGWEHRTF